MGDIITFPWREAAYGERDGREQEEAAANIYWLAERLSPRKKEEDSGPPSDVPCG